MFVKERISRFLGGESGAVTVDWVVLTAAVVGMATMAMISVRGGTMILADKIAHTLGSHIHPE